MKGPLPNALPRARVPLHAMSHASRYASATSCSVRRLLRDSLGAFLEVGDEVGAVLRLFKPGEDHLRARDVLLRVEQVVVERVLAPLDALVLVRGGVRETLRRAGDAAEQTAEVGALYAFSVVSFGNEAVSAPRDMTQNRKNANAVRCGTDSSAHSGAPGSPPGNRAGVRSAGEVFRGGGSGVGRTGGGDRRSACGLFPLASRRTYLLVAAAGLGDVALRALGLEDLRACESRHPRWERRG